MITHYFYNQVI